MRSRVGVGVVVTVLVAALGCSGGDGGSGRDGASDGEGDGGGRGDHATELPEPVDVRDEPEGATTLADPAFEALPGAEAEFGRLGGAVYQMEVPDEWNGQLVLWVHGFEDFDGEASASAPDIRASLIARGYAWAGSSFSSTAWIPGRAADETAALWDHFARTHRRPDHTYVIGLSMGGAASHIAAERYADRFDGVLALCGAAGATPGLTDGTNMFTAGAFAAGVTQSEYDANRDVGALIDTRIRPVLDADPAKRARFEDLVIDLTGGPRPFAREGLRVSEDTNWRRLQPAVTAGVTPPRREPYADEELNDQALRLRTNDDLLADFVEGNELTGDIGVPLLTMHTTGDAEVPIEQARILRRMVDDAGPEAGDRLVQRVIRDPGHCGFTTPEQAQAFEDLVRWVEDGERPAGNDVLSDDLAHLDPAFELQPRPGTPEADQVAGASNRRSIHGRATLDGQPLTADFFGAVVIGDGLAASCQHGLEPVAGGQFEVTVVAATETLGCGRQGTQVVMWTYAGDTFLHATTPIDWPSDADRTIDAGQVTFDSSDSLGARPPATSFVGEALGPDGRYVPPGTPVEAYVGDTLCGATSTRATGSFAGYSLMVVGPDSIPGCTEGAELTFRVGGHPAAQTAPNNLGDTTQAFDLTP